mmetsp:Transcript_14126/g.29944  ORF Transcript_14126/g.29944 Transcript_14126/m.29944 type:complete len:105 (-) Transcript_14126:105-419(-)
MALLLQLSLMASLLSTSHDVSSAEPPLTLKARHAEVLKARDVRGKPLFRIWLLLLPSSPFLFKNNDSEEVSCLPDDNSSHDEGYDDGDDDAEVHALAKNTDDSP